MNKAEEFHKLADDSHKLEQDYKAILSTIRKFAVSGRYFCSFELEKLAENSDLLTDRLASDGFKVKITTAPYNNVKVVEISW